MEKKRFLAGSMSIALAVTMFSTTAFAASVKFTDVPSDHWASFSITEMADKGIMSGVGNNKFAPDQTLTGAEFVTMVVRQFYEDKIGTSGGVWYSAFMDVAEKEGILSGTGITAEGTISRYDMAQLMYNVLKDQGITTSPLSDTSKVADWASVPSSYQNAVSACYNMGMLSGIDSKGTFGGNGSMDRAQAAVVMSRLIDVCGDSTATPEVPEAPAEIPADAKPITQLTQLTSKKGLETYENGFHADAGSIMYGCATFGVATEGYSVLTLTVRAADTDVSVYSNVGLIGQSPYEPGEHRGTEIIKAGETRTIVFDVSGSQSCGLSFKDATSEFDGQFAECWITDIYLY